LCMDGDLGMFKNDFLFSIEHVCWISNSLMGLADVRISYAKVLSAFLNNEGMPKEQEDTDSTQLTYFNQPAIHFLNTLHLSLYQYALSDIAQPADHVALLTLLRALLVRFRADQIIRGIPVVFKLQSEAKEEKLKDYAHQRTLASVIALYFSDIATVLDIPELREYIEKASAQLLCDSRIQSERIAKRQWSSYIKVASSENNLDDIGSFKPSEGEIPNGDDHPLQPIDIWLDRQIIVSMLSQHKEFSGIDGKKLEVDLMAEWKPEEGFEKVKKERYRIKSSRIVEKPYIAITPFIMNLEDSSGDLPKIKVENLKDALVQATTNDSSEHDTSVASDMESINMVPLNNGKKRKKKPKTDINAFLQSIDNTKASSTTSLVNAPYRS
ncbi:16288_t:CDS:2, partial [Acaulospora morrowiae]